MISFPRSIGAKPFFPHVPFIHLFTAVKGSAVPVQTQGQADCTLHYVGRAACQGRLKGGVCEDVAQQRGFPSDIDWCRQGARRDGLQRRCGQPKRRARLTSERERPKGRKPGRSTHGGAQKVWQRWQLQCSKSEDDALASGRLSELRVVRSLALRASANAAPAVRPEPCRGSSRSQVDTSVVSIASCESLQSDAHPVERHQRCSALDGPGPRKGHSGGAQKSWAGAGAGGEQRHAEKRRAGDSSGETGLVVKTLVAIRT